MHAGSTLLQKFETCPPMNPVHPLLMCIGILQELHTRTIVNHLQNIYCLSSNSYAIILYEIASRADPFSVSLKFSSASAEYVYVLHFIS